MIGWQIFSQSVLRVFNNLGAAIRVSLVPYLIAVVVIGVLVGSAVMSIMQLGSDPVAMQAAFTNNFPWLQFIVAFVVAIVCFTWTAVAWHRYILLDETPGWLPPFNGGRIWAYILRTILVALILIPVAIIAILVLGIVGGIIGGAIGQANQALGVGIAFVFVAAAYVVAIVVAYRLYASLPGAAIDNGAGIGDAWRATAATWGTMLMLAIITVVISLLVSFVIGWVTGLAPTVGVVLQLVYSWIAGLVGVSIVTTLYGYYVEKRSIG
jgi:hypothetical protein